MTTLDDKTGRETAGTEKNTETAARLPVREEAGEAADELAVLADAALERNARDALLLDLRGLSDATDFFMIASGDSDTHARSIAQNVIERMERAGWQAAGIEGLQTARWILIDYIDVVVHIFLPRVRDFYRLERLWGDAPVTRLE